MKTNQYREYHRRQGQELDRALARIMAGPRHGIRERIPGGDLDRFITIGVARYGRAFEGFAHGVAEGKINSDGVTDAGRLYRSCYVASFGTEAQTLDYLLSELGIVEQFEAVILAAARLLRACPASDVDSAWTVLAKHYYVTDDEDGIYAYRRRPKQPATE